MQTVAAHMEHIVIIGNGISGITTARHIRKRGGQQRITVISAETDHFFSRTALMYVYMGHMKFEHTKPYEDWFWAKNGIELKRAYVKQVDTDAKTLHFSEGDSMPYDKLVLAVGSKPNKFDWPGQDLPGVQGLYSYQDLELMEENTKGIQHAVIVGGGLIGIEMAEMLLSRKIGVTFLVREGRYWGSVLPEEESQLVMRHMKEHHVDLRLHTELKEVLAGADGRVHAVTTSTGEVIECQFVGLTAGVSPNIAFLKDSKIDTQRGILVNRYLETNIPDVYAIGDCAQFHEAAPGRRNLEQVWYTGRIMGETLAATLTGERSAYRPGIWFNSAKFFDIEYQTYGWVLANLPDTEEAFYWEDATGKVCIKLVCNKKTERIVGINAFGMRLRHHVCDQWIRERKTIDYCIAHLRDANFDPEFYKKHEQHIVDEFNKERGVNVQLKARSWKRIIQAVKQAI